MGDRGDRRQSSSREAELLCLSDIVHDQLLLLNYDSSFCNSEFPPVGPSFFVTSSNSPIQLKYFTHLVFWLIRKCGREPTWSQWDDPSTVFTNLMVLITDLNGGRDLPDTSLGELRKQQGTGESVLRILNFLATLALKQSNFVFALPDYPEDFGQAEDDVEDMVGVDNDFSNVDIERLVQQHHMLTSGVSSNIKATHHEEDRKAITSTVSPAEWQLEVERVALKLHVSVPETGQLVKAHLDTSKSARQTHSKEIGLSAGKLQNLEADINKKLSVIQAKERELNARFAGGVGDHSTTKVQIGSLRKVIHDKLNEVSRLEGLAKLESARHLELQEKLDERNALLSDTSELHRKRESLQRMKDEVAQMSLRAGVVAHQLLHAKMRERQALRIQQMTGVTGVGGGSRSANGGAHLRRSDSDISLSSEH